MTYAAGLALALSPVEPSAAEGGLRVKPEGAATLHVSGLPAFCAELEMPSVERRPALPGTGGEMIPPLGEDHAVCSEFREIERRGTAEAYRLFIERHPDHPLAEEAQERLERLDAR